MLKCLKALLFFKWGPFSFQKPGGALEQKTAIDDKVCLLLLPLESGTCLFQIWFPWCVCPKVEFHFNVWQNSLPKKKKRVRQTWACPSLPFFFPYMWKECFQRCSRVKWDRTDMCGTLYIITITFPLLPGACVCNFPTTKKGWFVGWTNSSANPTLVGGLWSLRKRN